MSSSRTPFDKLRTPLRYSLQVVQYYSGGFDFYEIIRAYRSRAIACNFKRQLKLHRQLRSRPSATELQPAKAGFASAYAPVAATSVAWLHEHAIALTRRLFSPLIAGFYVGYPSMAGIWSESTIPTMSEMIQPSGLLSTPRAPFPSRLTSTVSPIPAWVLSRATKSPSGGSPGSVNGCTTNNRRFL